MPQTFKIYTLSSLPVVPKGASSVIPAFQVSFTVLYDAKKESVMKLFRENVDEGFEAYTYDPKSLVLQYKIPIHHPKDTPAVSPIYWLYVGQARDSLQRVVHFTLLATSETEARQLLLSKHMTLTSLDCVLAVCHYSYVMKATDAPVMKVKKYHPRLIELVTVIHAEREKPQQMEVWLNSSLEMSPSIVKYPYKLFVLDDVLEK